MNRNWHRRAISRLPILSAVVVSAGGLLCAGAVSSALAQAAPSASGQVTVNYDVLNSLPGQAQQYGAPAGAQLRPLVAPRYAPPPAGYGAVPPYPPYASAGGLIAPPNGRPSSVLTTIGPDGRPIAPITLFRPAPQAESAQKPKSKSAPPSNAEMAAVTPPAEPSEVPSQVPMPQGTPSAPAPGVNAEMAPAAPAVETPTATVETAPPAAEATAPSQPASEPEAQQQAAQEPPAPEQAAPAPAEATPPAQAEAPKPESEGQPAEQAAAEPPPPEPENSMPAPPIPQGGIRIIFPTELNDVPSEAFAALDDLAAQMQADDTMRIEIKCYSSGTADTENKARRKSLQRCLNIRQYLFKKDVRTTRMDVRALGLKSEGQPADRVDIVPANS